MQTQAIDMKLAIRAMQTCHSINVVLTVTWFLAFHLSTQFQIENPDTRILSMCLCHKQILEV